MAVSFAERGIRKLNVTDKNGQRIPAFSRESDQIVAAAEQGLRVIKTGLERGFQPTGVLIDNATNYFVKQAVPEANHTDALTDRLTRKFQGFVGSSITPESVNSGIQQLVNVQESRQ